MNRNTKSRRALAHKNFKKGNPTTKFAFGDFTQEITVGKCPRRSKNPKVAGRNAKHQSQRDGQVVGNY